MRDQFLSSQDLDHSPQVDVTTTACRGQVLLQCLAVPDSGEAPNGCLPCTAPVNLALTVVDEDLVVLRCDLLLRSV